MAVTLRQRIFVGFGVALLLLGVVAWFSYQNAGGTVESARWVARTREVLETLDGLVAEVATAEAAYRDFLVWGQDASLKPLQSAFREAPAALARLRSMTSDNAAQQERLDTLTKLVAGRLIWSQKVVDTRRARGAIAAQNILGEARDPGFTTAFHGVVQDIRNAEELLLQQRTVALNRAARRTKLLILTGTLLAGLLAALAAFQVSRDLAARQRAERILRESEERFRALVEDVKDYAIFGLDVAGRVASWNAGAERLKGYRADEIVGQPFSRFYTPEDVAAGKPERELRSAAADGRLEDEGWRVRRDGSRFWANAVMTARRDRDGALIGFAKITRDVTERKQAEEAVRASEAKFRTLAVTANDAIISADSAGNVTYFNPAAERIFGYAGAEVVGRAITMLMPERFHAAHRAGMRRYLTTGEARVVGTTVELAARRKDGSEFPIELSLAASHEGAAPEFTAVIRDITERRRRDEELRLYAAQLETANAELDAFAYSVSHDLRAPLRSIDGFGQALLEDYGSHLDAAARGHLDRVRAASQRMAGLIDDLLGLSRVTRAELRRERVDLSALAQSVAAELQEADPKREVEFAIAPGLVVEADPHLLRLVLENLLGNARKYTAKRPHARIEFGATERDGRLAYYVRDNGAGFDMAYAGKLFGAFQRLHSAAEFEGTGIGLATVQRIIHRHGGRVWAEGVVGEGATFSFTL